jgi:hypothetical protein
MIALQVNLSFAVARRGYLLCCCGILTTSKIPERQRRILEIYETKKDTVHKQALLDQDSIAKIIFTFFVQKTWGWNDSVAKHEATAVEKGMQYRQCNGFHT